MQGLAKQSIYIMQEQKLSIDGPVLFHEPQECTYSERELVDFGNYIFQRYGVMVYSNDGQNQPIYERMVHDADICNWKAAQKQEYLTSGVENLRQVEGIYAMLCKIRNADVEMITDGSSIYFHYNNAKSSQMKRSELEKMNLTTLTDFVTENFDQIAGENKLPSRFQNGDKVKLCFANAGELTNAEIIKVHFSESKVLYDVELAVMGTDKLYHTRLYNIDSVFVEPAE